MTPEERAEIIWGAVGRPAAAQRAIATQQIEMAIAEEREACAQIAESGITLMVGGVETGVVWQSPELLAVARGIRLRG